MKDNISIIIPAYNAQAYIGRSVSSALRQTYNEIEVIVVNDGSIDETERICLEMAMSDNRLHVISVQNGGPARARNIGMQQAKGKWIVFLDADDAMEEDACRKLMENAERSEADIIFCNLVNIYSDRDEFWVPFKGEFQEFTGERKNWLERCLVSKNSETGDPPLSLSGPVCKLIRKQIMEGMAFPENITLGEDTCFSLMLIEKAKKITYISDCLYLRYCRTDSLSMCGYDLSNRLIKYTNWVIDRYGQKSYFRDDVKVLVGKNLVFVIKNYLIKEKGSFHVLSRQVKQYKKQQKMDISFWDMTKISIKGKNKIFLLLYGLHLDFFIFLLGRIRRLILQR